MTDNPTPEHKLGDVVNGHRLEEVNGIQTWVPLPLEPAAAKPKSKLTKVLLIVIGSFIGLIVLISVIAGLTRGVTGDREDASDDKPAPIAEESEAPEPEPEEENGTLENPLPLGYPASVYQGSVDNTLATVTVAILDPNANVAIAQANQFNDAAQPGYHYVAIQYTFTGESKTEPASVSQLLWDWSLAEEDGTLISESNTFVVMPDSWANPYDVNDLYQGQTGSAVVIYQVPDNYAGKLFATAYGSYITL
jgi:hypothetical protein